MRRDVKLATTFFLTLVLLLFVLAAYGYFSGAWETPP